jgi:hypothetical protein
MKTHISAIQWNIRQTLKKNSRSSASICDDVEKVNDPKAQALFEVSAEVIDGLQKAFRDYDKRNESAWANKPIILFLFD